MKFCTNCGAQLPDGSKFCTECGQRIEQAESVAQAPKPEAPAAVHVYGQPVNHSFSEPVIPEAEQGVVHTYGAPVSHNFAPPIQAESALSGSYGTAAPVCAPVPAPEPVAVPVSVPAAEPVSEPIPASAVMESGSYTPPVITEEKKEKSLKLPAAPKLPAMPKLGKAAKGGKKKSRLGLIVVLVIALAVGLFSCIGGGGDSDDPNLGVYNAVSCSYGGFEMSAEGEWIELKSGGKLKMNLMGEEYSGKWELDGESLTVTQAGDTYYGTLEDGVIVLDLAGLTYTYEKEVMEQDKNDKAPTEPTEDPEDNSEGQESGKKTYYTAISGNVSNAEMNESTINQAGGVTLVFNGDGTGTFDMFGQSDEITYDDSTITRQGMTMTYTLEGDYLYLHVSDAIDFTMMTKMDAMNRPQEELTLDDIGYWEGDYYGWWVIDNVIVGNSSAQGNWWDCCMSLDINTDGTGSIIIWDEDYGKDDPIAEVEVSVSNYAGVTRIVSESGQFLGDPVEHADWLFYSDATDYKDTLGFTATYEDDSTKMDCYFFLRQWGTIWDDVEEKDLPGYYDSWYLPLLNDGVTAAPETIG